MPKFTATIQINNQPYTFVFYEVMVPAATKFFVSVSQQGKEITTFEMKQEGKSWRLVQPVPDFILAEEGRLIDLILRNR